MCGSQRPSRVRTLRSHRPMRACDCTKSSNAARRRISASFPASASRETSVSRRTSAPTASTCASQCSGTPSGRRTRRRASSPAGGSHSGAAGSASSASTGLPSACAPARPVSASKAALTQVTRPRASSAASATGAPRAQACSAAGSAPASSSPHAADAALGLEKPSGADMAWRWSRRPFESTAGLVHEPVIPRAVAESTPCGSVVPRRGSATAHRMAAAARMAPCPIRMPSSHPR